MIKGEKGFAAASLAALMLLVFVLTDASYAKHAGTLRKKALHRRQTGTGQAFDFSGPYDDASPPVNQQDCTQPASNCPPLPSDMSRDATKFENVVYDYIIMGAGNAGLVVANRLSEDPSIKILVVEGGDDTRKDVTIYKANETYALNNVPNGPHVYQYYTVPQINGTMKLEWYGKGLGGSTTVNGQVWDAPHRSQVDDIGKLGNEGWDWETLLKYYKKAQDYHQPSKELVDRFGIKFDPAVHNQGGPVTIAHLNQTFSGPPQIAYVKAVKSLLGINPGDLQSGDNNAVAYVPQTLYPDTDLRRVSSATAYYEPISEKRKNLNILLTWRVVKLNFDADNATANAQPPQRRATDNSTQVMDITIQQKRGGPTVTLKSKHYILSAGSVASPYILEHSGVGDKKILDKINVPQKVDLPGVGHMFGEQTQVGLNAFVKDRAWRGLGASSSIAQPTIQQLFTKNVSDMEAYVRKNLDEWAQQQVDVGAAVSKDAVMEQYKLMTEGIFKNSVPVNENFFGNGFYGNESDLSMSVYTLTPYSKGYSHANTSDPWDVPEVNPRYYQTPFDMDIEVASLRAGKALFNTTELRDVMSETNYTSGMPSTAVSTPDCANCTVGSTEEYAFFRDHVISSFGILDHAVGTCSMMPRKLGGVVDSRFRVYGIGNLRIVDASILPMQISAHPQATVYAIAEYASDLIKADDGLHNNRSVGSSNEFRCLSLKQRFEKPSQESET